MKCKHEACKCNNQSQGGFCSDSCKQSKMNGGKCGCGHGDCK